MSKTLIIIKIQVLRYNNYDTIIIKQHIVV